MKATFIILVATCIFATFAADSVDAAVIFNDKTSNQLSVNTDDDGVRLDPIETSNIAGTDTVKALDASIPQDGNARATNDVTIGAGSETITKGDSVITAGDSTFSNSGTITQVKEELNDNGQLENTALVNTANDGDVTAANDSTSVDGTVNNKAGSLSTVNESNGSLTKMGVNSNSFNVFGSIILGVVVAGLGVILAIIIAVV